MKFLFGLVCNARRKGEKTFLVFLYVRYERFRVGKTFHSANTKDLVRGEIFMLSTKCTEVGNIILCDS